MGQRDERPGRPGILQDIQRRGMRSPYARTGALLIVFGALLAYVLLVEAKREAPADAGATPTPSPILDIQVDDVRSLQISDGEREVRIVQEGESWRITAPGEGPADAYAIYLPLSDLTQIEAKLVVLEEVTDRATYGLDPVALTLVIETQSGATERITVGRQTPDQTSYYLQREGDPRLYTVSHYKIQTFFDWLLDPPYEPTPTPETNQDG